MVPSFKLSIKALSNDSNRSCLSSKYLCHPHHQSHVEFVPHFWSVWFIAHIGRISILKIRLLSLVYLIVSLLLPLVSCCRFSISLLASSEQSVLLSRQLRRLISLCKDSLGLMVVNCCWLCPCIKYFLTIAKIFYNAAISESSLLAVLVLAWSVEDRLEVLLCLAVGSRVCTHDPTESVLNIDFEIPLRLSERWSRWSRGKVTVVSIILMWIHDLLFQTDIRVVSPVLTPGGCQWRLLWWWEQISFGIVRASIS